MFTCRLVQGLDAKDRATDDMVFIKLFYFFIWIAAFLNCAPFRDSPYSDQVLRLERNINGVALDRISGVDNDQVIRIAVFADSHQNYRDFDHSIRQLNRTANVDFVVHLGDFSNSGYNLEFDQYVDSFVTITAPALSVIGNHDAIGAGPAIFRKVFGSSNFWFECDKKRFIFFNSANLEDPAGFDPLWLLKAVQGSVKPVIVFSHVNLRDSDRFQGRDAEIFQQVIWHPQTQMILNGHNHAYRYLIDGGTVMLEADRVEGGRWLLLEVYDHQTQITRMESKTSVWVPFKN